MNYDVCYTALDTAKETYKEFFMQDNQMQAHLSYIAGVMDSDGCFMITRHKRKTTRKNHPHKVNKWAWTYLAAVKICQVDIEAIDLIMKTLNLGTLTISGVRPSRPNSQPIYQWGIRNRIDLPIFLELVIPYLRIKKKRAQFLLEYCRTAKYLGGKKSGYFGLDENELNYREESYHKMRKFNCSKAAAETEPSKHESASDSPNNVETH